MRKLLLRIVCILPRVPTVLGIRHGEVENPSNVIYARMPGFHLSERGREMAGRLGGQLAGAPVTAVYASPLDRARETAEAIAAPHGLEVRTDDRLIEWSFWTQWQGTPWAEVRDRSPETFSRYEADPGSLHPEDSLAAVGARVLEWADEAAEMAGGAGNGGIVIGVSHEAPLAAAYLAGSGLAMAGFAAAHIPHLQAVRLRPEAPELLDPADLADLV